jgi:hypothetical protein
MPQVSVANSLPDQKALNEAAIAARRAAYQAKVAAESQTPPTVAPKASLLASEAKEYIRLLQSGKTAREAMDAIETQRAFVQRFGTPTPTAEQLRFAKLSKPAPLP